LLAAALNPQSIAVIGASDNRNKIGGRPIHFLKTFGYAGKVYPINPNRGDVQGIACYPNLDALPDAPELAVICVAGDDAAAAVKQCARRGVKVAVCIASGFGETGEAGRKIEAEMVAAARAAGMRMIGPNTQGLANFATGAITSFSTMFIEVPPQDGPVAIVSQSGAASVIPYYMLRERGIGVRYVLASGNDADVNVCELLPAVLRDEAVRLVIVYAETIKDAASLAAAARMANERGVPIVMLKSGRSARGAQAASSHTGAIANEDRVVDAFLRKHGIWRAGDTRGWVNAAELYLQGHSPKRGRLVALSNSGALCVLAADLAERFDLPLARLSAHTRERLAAALPSFATSSNPIDVTAALLTDSGLFGKVLPALAEDEEVDLVYLAIPVAGEGYDLTRFGRDAAAFVAQTGKVLVMSATQASVRAPFRAEGIPVFETESDALAALHQYTSHRTSLSMANVRQEASDAAPANVALPDGSEPFLSEAQSMAVLAQAGIEAVAHRLCNHADEAVAAWRTLAAPTNSAAGGQVAVKACSPGLPHKSEYGLVFLHCATEQAVRDAFRACSEGMQRANVKAEGVLVARMVAGKREFALGAKIDPVFGPVVMVSDGGKYIEAMPDNILLLPPFDEADVSAALQRLRIAPLLAGVRGEAALDVPALCRLAVRLGALMHALRGRARSIDLNPVMLGAAGEGAVVVDALIERA
jgi:acyl-CoA synthetase (NDP forming)